MSILRRDSYFIRSLRAHKSQSYTHTLCTVLTNVSRIGTKSMLKGGTETKNNDENLQISRNKQAKKKQLLIFSQYFMKISRIFWPSSKH